MTVASLHRLPAGSELRSRPELTSPFSELLAAPIIAVAKTERILTTPFERHPETASVAEVATDSASVGEKIPAGGLAWSSPASCTTSPASDVVSVPRTRARFKRR
jgi:hypothetical protein